MLNARRLVLLTLCAAAPLAAQRGASRPQRGATTTTTKADTTQGKPGAPQQQPYALDYQEQDLRAVLNALAEAGNLNVTMTNIPQVRVSVRMARPVTRDTLIAIITGIAEQNGVKVTNTGGLLRLEGDPNASPTARQAAQQQAAQLAQQQQNQQQNQLRLYTYRLKHASATVLAPVLMNLIGATTGANAQLILPGGATVTPGGVNIGVPGQANPAPGRGGRGGQDQTANVQTLGPGGAAGGGNLNLGFGAGGGGGGRAGQIAGAAIANALQNVFQQQGIGGIGTLSTTSNQIRIVAEEGTNSLLIRASQADYQLLQGVIGAIDLRPLQVLIEVSIAEVSRTHDLNLGIGGTATQKKNSTGTLRDTLALLPGNISAQDFILQLTGGGGSVSYNAAINALQTRGDVKILSLPVIIAQNNKEASLNVGQQRPFVQVNQSVTTGTVPTTVQTVTYLSVGTTLTITPTINPDGYVNMAVDQTNNSATEEVQFNAPVISQREAKTQIFLKDGQTTVIGGLSDNSYSKTVGGIPLLSRIPWIGGLLFGNTKRSTSASELFLFLTPHIITSDEDIDRLRNSLRNGTELLKDMQIGPRIVPIDSIPTRKPDSTMMKAPAKRPDPR